MNNDDLANWYNTYMTCYIKKKRLKVWMISRSCEEKFINRRESCFWQVCCGDHHSITVEVILWNCCHKHFAMCTKRWHPTLVVEFCINFPSSRMKFDCCRPKEKNLILKRCFSKNQKRRTGQSILEFLFRALLCVGKFHYHSFHYKFDFRR